MRNPIIILIMISLPLLPLRAQVWQPLGEALPTDLTEGAAFGAAVDIEGGYAAAGAPQAIVDGVPSGAVYLFKEDAAGRWQELARLTPPEGVNGGGFGRSIAMSGAYLLLGAEGDALQGAAYLYKNDGTDNFTFIAELTASDGMPTHNFGVSLDMDGDHIAIGADAADGKGAVYIFRDNGNDQWDEVAKISPDGQPGDGFGGDVVINGAAKLLIAGAKGDDTNGAEAGAAYVFRDDQTGNWVQTAKITPADASAGDGFGSAVALYTNYAALSAPAKQGGGAVYIFRYNNVDWEQNATLTAAGGEGFGQQLDFHANWLAASADTEGEGGGVHIFQKGGDGTFSFIQKNSPCHGEADDRFGSDLALRGGRLFVGADNHAHDGIRGGGGYFYGDGPIGVCDVASPIVSGAGIHQSGYSQIQGGWRYFCDCDGSLLLALSLATAPNASIPDDGVRVLIGESPATYHPGGTGFITNPDGAAVMNRRWHISADAQPGVNGFARLRFFFTADEYEGVSAALGGQNGAWTLDSPYGLDFFKLNETPATPFPGIGDILPGDIVALSHNSEEADFTTWSLGQHGNGADYFAESMLTNLSSGGGGAGAGGDPASFATARVLGFRASIVEVEDDNDDVLLEWELSSALGEGGFFVERSRSSALWETLGFVDGSNATTFEYLDADPHNGNNYYRLRQVGSEGGISYSQVLNIWVNNRVYVEAHPRPVFKGEDWRVYINVERRDEAVLRFVNPAGVIAHSRKVEVEPGLNRFFVNTTSLPAGWYLLQVEMDGRLYRERLLLVE